MSSSRWAVVSHYYDDGKVEARIFDTDFDRQEMNAYRFDNKSVRDTYTDYFESYAQAKDYAKACE